MPGGTILDELVVVLGLDPSQFDAEQQKVADKLGDLEKRASQGNRQISRQVDETGKRFLDVLDAIGRPVAVLETHLRRIVLAATPTHRAVHEVGEQGRRTGEQVAAGALAGAAGYRILAGTILAAGAATTALVGGMKAVGEQARTVFGVGVGAATAGMPIREFSAVSQALLVAGNVPEEQTQGWLESVKRNQLLLQRTGKFDNSWYQAFARLGIGSAALTADPERLMQMVAERLARMSPAEATMWGRQLHMPPAMAQSLRRLGSRFPEAVAAQRPTAITPEQQRDFARYLSQINALKTAFDALGRTIGSLIAPDLTAFAKKLDETIKGIEKDPAKVKILTDSLAALAAVVGVTMVAALAKLTASLNAFWATPAIKFLVSPAGAALMAFIGVLSGWGGGSPAIGHEPDIMTPAGRAKMREDINRDRAAHGLPPLPPSAFQPPTAPAGQAPADQRNWWQRTMPSWLGGQPAPQPAIGISTHTSTANPGNIRGAGGVGFAVYSSEQGGVNAIRNNLLAYYHQHHLNTLRGIISRWAPPNENPTTQLIANAARRTGFGPDQPLNLDDPAVMRKLMSAVFWQEQGYAPPEKVRQMIASAAPRASAARALPAPNLAYLRSLNRAVQMIHHHHATVNNRNAVNNPRITNNNSVTVTAPSDNAKEISYAVGGAISDAVKRNITAMQANTGLN